MDLNRAFDIVSRLSVNASDVVSFDKEGDKKDLASQVRKYCRGRKYSTHKGFKL